MSLVILATTSALTMTVPQPAPEALFQQGLGFWRSHDRAQAAECYRTAAEAGHAEAMAHLGRMFFRGEGIPKQPDLALIWLQKSAARKNGRGLYHLAELYQDGVAVERSQETYARLLEQAAQAGSPDALAELGQCLWFGHGVPRDREKAEAMFRKAATLPRDQFYPGTLAWLLRDGHGFAKDSEAAFKEAFRANTEGYGTAGIHLATYYSQGVGTDKNPSKALALLTAPENLTNPRALMQLARMLEKGEGLSENPAQAFQLYRKTALTGEPIAMLIMGVFCQRGLGTEKNPEEGFKWLLKSADAGFPVAIGWVGQCYLHGRGTAPNISAALKWIRKGADLNEPGSLYNLGWCHQEGIGVEKDPKEALKFYLRSADMDFPAAVHQVGWCYESGIGVEKNIQTAIQRYQQAAQAGWSWSESRMGWIYLNGIGVTSDYTEALRWYRIAAEHGNPNAMAQIGWMHENGLGIPRDLGMALEQYYKAGGKDYAWAWFRAGSVLLQPGHPFSNPEKARRSFGEGAALKDKACMRELGRCLLMGLGGPVDRDLAIDWLRKAADAGDAPAGALLKLTEPKQEPEADQEASD